MFLKEIHLKNFRNLDSLSLSFDKQDMKNSVRKWTVILGENGTGKSGILKAIALIIMGSDALAELIGKPEDWIKYGKDYCEVTAVITTKENEISNLKLRINRGESLSDILKKNEESLQLIDRAIDHATRNYFIVGYGATRKLSTANIQSSKRDIYRYNRAQSVATLFNPDASLHSLESWAMDLDYRKEGSGLKTVKQALDKFLPGVTFYKIDKENRQLLFKTQDGIIPLSLLSDGYQNMAGWLADLLYHVTNSFDDYETALKARGLLLLDELELHLHPVWQKELFTFINRLLPNFQIITTTHSPLTAQQAGENELIYLERIKGNIVANQFEGSPRKLLLHQLLTSDVFGLSTDESVYVEKLKAEYKQLKSKEKKSEKEEKKLRELKESIELLPKNPMSNSFLTSDMKDQLTEIRKSLKKDLR